jgi:hypothetical protein
MTTGRDACYQGQRRGHGGQREPAACPIGMTTRRDLSHRGPVRRGSHEAFRRADDGGGLARGPGEFG